MHFFNLICYKHIFCIFVESLLSKIVTYLIYENAYGLWWK